MREIIHKNQALLGEKTPVMLIAIMACLLFWLLDAYLHVYLFGQDQHFMDALFPHNLEELWMRFVIIFLILGISFISKRIIDNTKKSTQQIRAILENTNDAYMAIDSSWNVIFINRIAEQFLGLPRKDVIGNNLWDMFPEAAGYFFKPFTRSMREQEPCTCTGFYSALGKWVEVNTYPDKDYMSFYLHDITSSIEQKNEIKKLEAMLSSANDAIISINDYGIVEQFNSAAEAIFGYKPGEIIGKNISMIMPEPDASNHDKYIRKFLHTGNSNIVNAGPKEFIAKRKGGDTFPVELSVSDVVINDRRYFVGIMRDITARKHAQNALEYMSNYDSLTGLPNRTLFTERLKQTIKSAKREDKHFALMFIDLDKFKKINDTLGHTAGDELLKIFADRLKLCVRGSDTIARLGGDEYTIILDNIADIDNSEKIAEKIIKSMSEPVLINLHKLVVTPSIGISIYPRDGETESDLLKNADIAMYKAKEMGRNNYQVYAPHMNRHDLEKIKLEHDMGEAINNNQFELYYQPQIDLGEGQVVGLEALIRWNHPQRGVIPPDDFIPILEDTGLILTVGEWVMREACEQNAKWHASGFGDIRISVNLSAMQFRQKELVNIITNILTSTNMDAKYLELEITEGLLVEDIESTFEILNSLHSKGIQLSIDDFGTGYSSMNYLQRFPLQTLKIDRSFINEITTNKDDAAIATAIIELAHRLRLRVIAEGVENERQLIFLRAHNCDEVQGYYFCKPLPASQITVWLNDFIGSDLSTKDYKVKS